ncbi:alpha/beta hydrolase family protein [Methylobacterium goesingense]|uniref:Dienelactone hydrolase n=1 Tax=Methylobacterium goesingense TaxID=243690 RepID=A0ABV2LAE0_9HYPH|nr:dienelactone hydrolase [Methylobacterium goesingense]
MEIGIWYPASGPSSPQRLGLFMHDVVAASVPPQGPHPLVVMSHGTGGDFTSHADTAVALARAGFIVAALTQPGDNWRDASRATRIEERPKTLSRLIDYMLGDWSGLTGIDRERIGAFGFSSGGFTVLAAAGGRPDLTRVAEHCAAHPALFDCSLIQAKPNTAIGTWPDLHDRRIKAIAVAAPALGFTFDRAGAAAIRVPVQLWRADDDEILPAPFYADAVRAVLPVPPAFHGVPEAGHFDFLSPCAEPRVVPHICASRRGFDRTAFHQRFNGEVVRFFRQALPR